MPLCLKCKKVETTGDFCKDCTSRRENRDRVPRAPQSRKATRTRRRG